MQNVNFPTPSPETHHTCESRIEGDWIIWTCPDCEGYERKLNWKTREMRSSVGHHHELHTGLHVPTGIDSDIGCSMN